jgi:hypothetical protein
LVGIINLQQRREHVVVCRVWVLRNPSPFFVDSCSVYFVGLTVLSLESETPASKRPRASRQPRSSSITATPEPVADRALAHPRECFGRRVARELWLPGPSLMLNGGQGAAMWWIHSSRHGSTSATTLTFPAINSGYMNDRRRSS